MLEPKVCINMETVVKRDSESPSSGSVASSSTDEAAADEDVGGSVSGSTTVEVVKGKPCDGTVTGKMVVGGKAQSGGGGAAISVVSSVGSFAPTLTDPAARRKGATGGEGDDDDDSTTQAAVSVMRGRDVIMDLPKDIGVAVGQVTKCNDGVMSSVGSGAPTLNTKKTSRTVSTSAVLTDSYIDTEGSKDDGMSSVGEDAPTLASARTSKTMSTKVTLAGRDVIMELPNEEILLEGSRSKDHPGDVSSVGSDAPTLATKRTINTSAVFKNTYIDATATTKSGISSVGDDAPTLATTKTTKTTSTSVQLVNKSIRVDGIVDENDDGELSTLGSTAPTLADMKKNKFTGPVKSPPNTSNAVLAVELNESVDGSSVDFDHAVSDVGLLGGVLGREKLTSALEDVVGGFLRSGAYAGIAIWLGLLVVMVLVAPTDSYQYMNATEQVSNAVLLTLLIGVNISRFGPLIVNDRNWDFLKSGAVTACCAVQCVAITSVAAMLLLPTPVIIDPIVGIRCHLLRWAEWTALAFIMTFLTEGIDLPIEDADTKSSWVVATMMAFSTIAGGILPFCPDLTSWLVVFVISCLLFCALPYRLIQKGWRLRNMPKGNTTSEKENYERARFSVKLLVICNVLWTLLVFAFTGCCIAGKYAKPGTAWASDWLVLVTENTCEAFSKIGYLSILMEIHEQIFDDVSKTARRLEELCTYMSAVWDVSSDVVIICSKNDHLVNAAVSPAFFQMGCSSGSIATKASNDQMTLVMEVDPYEGSYHTFDVDLSKPMTRDQADKMLKSNRTKTRIVTPIFEKNLRVLSDLVGDACACAIPEGQKQLIMAKDFYRLDEDKNEQPMYCEAKVVKLKGKVVLVVLRDVTQRLQLHEAHMKLNEEMNARKIDSNASQFARCAIRNELSTAISLLDSLKEKIKNGSETSSENYSDATGEEKVDASSMYKEMDELDTKLRQILTSRSFGPPTLSNDDDDER